jgi:hypothetical protein
MRPRSEKHSPQDRSSSNHRRIQCGSELANLVLIVPNIWNVYTKIASSLFIRWCFHSGESFLYSLLVLVDARWFTRSCGSHTTPPTHQPSPATTSPHCHHQVHQVLR